MESMKAGTKSGGGSTVVSHLSACELELLVFRIDRPGEPVPAPRMDDEDATTALRTQQTMHCVQENCLPCTGWIAPEVLGKTKPCTCTCHDTGEDDETEDDGEYMRELFADAAADMCLLD
jgi:hypothetical protein